MPQPRSGCGILSPPFRRPGGAGGTGFHQTELCGYDTRSGWINGSAIAAFRAAMVSLLNKSIMAPCGHYITPPRRMRQRFGYRIRPSVEMVTTCQGMNFPLFFSAVTAARSMPPQQGTSMRTTVRALMSFRVRISVSFSV